MSTLHHSRIHSLFLCHHLKICRHRHSCQGIKPFEVTFLAFNFRHPFLPAIQKALGNVKNVSFATNPCKILYKNRVISVFRENGVEKMSQSSMCAHMQGIDIVQSVNKWLKWFTIFYLFSLSTRFGASVTYALFCLPSCQSYLIWTTVSWFNLILICSSLPTSLRLSFGILKQISPVLLQSIQGLSVSILIG